MVRRFHRSIYDELDELKASMDYLFQLAFEPVDNPMLPEGEQPDIALLYSHSLNAEVTELDDAVIVTVDTIPGNESLGISVELVSPGVLKITCERHKEGVDGNDRKAFSFHHIIQLSDNVIADGARATCKNGVLDIRLRKALM